MVKWTERKEGWMRLVVGIVSGIVLYFWRYLIAVLAIFGFLVVIFSGKRNRAMAELSEWWNTEAYRFSRYMTFVSNERPFPFTAPQSMSRFK